MKKYGKIVIAIDQSYNRAGIAVIADGIPKIVTSMDYKKSHTNTEKRSELGMYLIDLIKKLPDAEEKQIIVERIRLKNAQHISEPYIKATSALIARVIDIASIYYISVFSVMTNSWKSRIVGTSKARENKYGIDPAKYPTILYVKKNYPCFFKKLLIPAGERKSKGVVTINNERFTINDDACDALCIGLYAFTDKPLLQEEKF